MTAYLLTLTGISLLATGAGWRSGRKLLGKNRSLTTGASVGVIGLALLWLLAAWSARFYADTDHFGAEWAEWFAHSGKWLVLLAALGFGNGFICGARQLPPNRARTVLYLVAVLGLAGLVVWRTVPVYFLLGDGRRDRDGYLRQSASIEVTCGAVALLNYLERQSHHAPLTEREVSRVCGVTMEGSTTSALVKAAHQFGLTNAAARVLTLAELENSRLPAIVAISTMPQVHHATLLVRLDANEVVFIDPAYGNWKISRERFQQIWYGKTIRFE